MSEPTGMDDRTLTALRGSIAKWEGIVERGRLTMVAILWSSCPLCVTFNNHNKDNQYPCRGCPVYENTGATGCKKTPYVAAEYAYHEEDKDAFLKAAREEVAFLRSLLPEGERGP